MVLTKTLTFGLKFALNLTFQRVGGLFNLLYIGVIKLRRN